MPPRPLDALLADVEEAAIVTAALVSRGKVAWARDQFLRLAGEALIGRIADAAGRLPDEVKDTLPDVPWDAIRDIRIMVDHTYHRVDYEILWDTLRIDVPRLHEQLQRFRTAD